MISKAKFMKKMAAVVIAGAMMTVMAVPVIAATSPIGKGVDGLKISKTLEKYENSYIPNTTFGFEIAPGVADPDNKVEVGLAGGVTFANGSTTGSIGFSSAKSDIGSKQETKDTALMVNASSFVEPGIYRYVIKETSTSGFEGIAYSTEKRFWISTNIQMTLLTTASLMRPPETNCRKQILRTHIIMQKVRYRI